MEAMEGMEYSAVVAGKEKRATAQRKDEVMKIGSFKFDERASDIIGKIATREMRFPYLIMRRVEDRQSDSASPDIEERSSQTEQAVAHLLAQLGALEDTEVRLLRAGDSTGALE